MPKHRRARRNESSPSWPVSCRWIAAGTLAVYSAIGCQKIALAQLPWRAAASGDAPIPASLPARRFDIPPGNMADVLQAFEEISGIRVVPAVDGIGRIPSPGVTGLFTPEQAFDRIVKNTGLRWRFTAPQTALVELLPVVSAVDVTATVDTLATSMPKYAAPLEDIPQTVGIVPQSVMQEQNLTTLRDTLRNVAGISLAAGEGGSQGDNLTIRGFTARNDLFIDGMRDFGSYYRDPFNLQEVEVLQGPSSVTFGRGSTGGVVNQATKTPALTSFVSGDIDAGTDLTRRISADVNTPAKWLG